MYNKPKIGSITQKSSFLQKRLNFAEKCLTYIAQFNIINEHILEEV